MRTNRSEYRSNVKAHRFVMDAPVYVRAQPQSATWPRVATWALLGALTLLGTACAVAMVVGAALTLAGVR